MSTLKALQRIPLWKRNIPKYPLYFKGDPQRRLLLPLFWMKMIEPKEKVPPNYVSFIVHPQMSKSDIKQYLEKIYNIPVLCVRTEIREKEVKGFPINDNQRHEEIKRTVWREQEKYAYVILRDSEFKYPSHFTLGKTTEMGENIDQMESFLKQSGDSYTKRHTALGLPIWFRK